MKHDISNSIIRGCWQLMPGHLVDNTLHDNLAPVLNAIETGFRIFDCADIYSGVEELLGRAQEINSGGGAPVRIHTKLVPDRDSLETIALTGVQDIVDRSLRRLRTDCLDLVQFHWWDYRVPRYLDVLGFLFRIKEAGKIKAIGLTNFDSARLQEVVSSGMQIASLQMQYSLVDRRAEKDMIPLCKANGIKVYTYGSLLGGFLSENWLDKPEPDICKVPNRSLVKYKLIIDDWGGWGQFQAFLRQLQELANARNCTIPQLATSSVLHSERVDAIIVGVSPINYERQNAELANLPGLNSDDLEKVWSWDCPLKGNVYELERTSGKHAGIMKYNLNRDSAQVPAQGKHG